MTQEMITYYAHRAAEYKRVYEGPRWQDDLARRLAAHASDVAYRELAWFWVLEYRTR